MDTRFVSSYRFFANGQPWVRLSSSAMTYDTARIYLTNAAIPTEDGQIPAGTIGLTISRGVEDGIHEDYDVTNYGLTPVQFMLEVEVRSDFVDLFEVKEHKFVRRGRIDSEVDLAEGQFGVAYVNRDFQRRLVYQALGSDSPVRFVNGRLVWEISLGPGESWHNATI